MLRYGGMFAIGMAYRGTDNNSAIKQLLHFAVSDVSDEVRRAAVINLGFVLLGVPKQCPRIVRLLAESYNPHLRYGAAMAVGIACAGTGTRPYPASCLLNGTCCILPAQQCPIVPTGTCSFLYLACSACSPPLTTQAFVF